MVQCQGTVLNDRLQIAWVLANLKIKMLLQFFWLIEAQHTGGAIIRLTDEIKTNLNDSLEELASWDE